MSKKDWELSGDQVRELRLAIRSAFVAESGLKCLLREELDFRWDEEITGDTYNAKISALIAWVETHDIDTYRKLVIGAASEATSNSKFRRYVETNISILIEYDIESLCDLQLVKLIALLDSIQIFDKILEIGKSILPNKIHINNLRETKYLESAELSNWFKYFILLKLLLSDYPGSTEQPTILTFVRDLLQKLVLSEETKQELSNWLQKVDPNFTNQGSEPSTLKESKQQSSDVLQAHLMITVNAEKSKFRVVASLLCIAPNGDNKRIPLNLNPESHERGKLCTKRQLKKELKALIDRSNLDLTNLANSLGCYHFNLIIELFLPIQLLYEPIDRWDVFGNNSHLAAEFPLVIRSFERALKGTSMQGKNLHNELCRSSAQAKQLLSQNPEPDLQDLIQPLTDLTNLNNEILIPFMASLEERIGVKSNCPPPDCPKQKYRLLLEILKSGVPFIFWSRCTELSQPDATTEMEEFLKIELLRDRYGFIGKLKRDRKSALGNLGKPKRRWLRHLTLIWDDPDLMPPMDSLQIGVKKTS